MKIQRAPRRKSGGSVNVDIKVPRYTQQEPGTPVSVAGAAEPVVIETDVGGEIGKVIDSYYEKKGHVELMRVSSDLEDSVRDFEEIPVGEQTKKKPHGSNPLQGSRMTYVQGAEVWFDETSKAGRKNLPAWLHERFDAEMNDRRDTFLDKASGRQQGYDEKVEVNELGRNLDLKIQQAYRTPEKVVQYFSYFSHDVDVLNRPDGDLLKLKARDKIYLSAVNGLARTDPDEAKAFLDKLYKENLPGDIYDKGLADIARHRAAIKKAEEASKKAANDAELAEVARYKLESQGLTIFQRHDLSEEIRLSGKLSDKNMTSLLTFIDKGPRLYGDGAIADMIDGNLEDYDLRDVEDYHTKREITDFEYTRLKAYYDHIQNDPAYKDQCGIAAGLVDDETFGEIETELDKAKAKNLKHRIDAGIAKAMAVGYEPEQARLEAMREVKRTKAHVRDWRWDKPYEPGELKKEVVKRGKEYSLSIAEIGKEDTALYNEILDELLAEFNNYPEELRGTLKGNVRERLILIKLVEMRLPGTAENRERAWREVQEDLK